MFNRKMRSKVNVGPATSRTLQPQTELRSRVSRRQQAVKEYTDAKRGASVPKIKEGSLVRVKKPFHVRKGLARFQDPTRVMRRAGSATFVLEDGRTKPGK